MFRGSLVCLVMQPGLSPTRVNQVLYIVIPRMILKVWTMSYYSRRSSIESMWWVPVVWPLDWLIYGQMHCDWSLFSDHLIGSFRFKCSVIVSVFLASWLVHSGLKALWLVPIVWPPGWLIQEHMLCDWSPLSDLLIGYFMNGCTVIGPRNLTLLVHLGTDALWLVPVVWPPAYSRKSRFPTYPTQCTASLCA